MLTEQALKQIHSDGYAVIPNVVPFDVVQSLLDAM